MFCVQWFSRCLMILICSISISVEALEVTPMVITLSEAFKNTFQSNLQSTA